MKMTVIVPVRLVRVDVNNIAVEKLSSVEIVELTETDGKKTRTKTGKFRDEWTEVAYYGRLDQAARAALTEAMPTGIPVTPEIVAQAVETICQRTADAMAVRA